MKQVIFILSLFLVTQAESQTLFFKDTMEKMAFSTDEYSAIETISVTDQEYDFLDLGSQGIKSIFLTEIANLTIAKNRPQISAMLETFSSISIQAWQGSQYENKQKWNRLKKHFMKADFKMYTGYSLFETAAFRIDLMNPGKESFFRKVYTEDDGLNLYLGKMPKTKEEIEEWQNNPRPVPYCTEQQIKDQIIRNLRKSGMYSKLKGGHYNYVGVSVEVDKNSLYKRKIPTARVVIFAGSRRLEKVRM